MAVISRGAYTPPNSVAPRRIGYGQKAAEENAWITADDPCRGVMSTFQTLCNAQQRRLWDNSRFYSLYCNYDFLAASQARGNREPSMPRMADNQIKVHTDTLVGKLVQSNSRVRMMTSNGDWLTWSKARKIEWALDGETTRMGLYTQAQKVATDAVVCGIGYLKLMLSPNGRNVDCERVPPNDVFVDNVEAAYGPPRTMYQVRYMRKDALLALYPDHAQIIERAKCETPPQFGWTMFRPGMVEMVEAWALPTGVRPGRHVLALSSGCLLDEGHDSSRFPIASFVLSDRPMSAYGQGFVEQVMGTQLVLNRTIQVMERAANLGIAPYWVVSGDSGVNVRQLQNKAGHIVTSEGEAPKWMTNAPFHEAAVRYVDMLRQSIADFYGSNSLETGGNLPLNRIDSKKALREYEDMTATRITTLIERWEDFYMDVARRTMDIAVGIAKTHNGYPVLIKKPYSRGMELDWKDLELDDDAYLMQPAPTDFISKTPAARIDDLSSLLQTGLITQKQAQRLMRGPPDLDAALGEATATEDDIDRLVEQFVEEEYEYRAPSTMQDLPRAIKRVSDARLQYANLGLPNKQLALFDRFVDDATDLLQTMAAPPPNPAQGVGDVEQQPGAPAGPPAQPAPGGSPAAPAGAAPPPPSASAGPPPGALPPGGPPLGA